MEQQIQITTSQKLTTSPTITKNRLRNPDLLTFTPFMLLVLAACGGGNGLNVSNPIPTTGSGQVFPTTGRNAGTLAESGQSGNAPSQSEVNETPEVIEVVSTDNDSQTTAVNPDRLNGGGGADSLDTVSFAALRTLTETRDISVPDHDTSSDTPLDTSSDTPPDTSSDAPPETSSDTPPDTPPGTSSDDGATEELPEAATEAGGQTQDNNSPPTIQSGVNTATTGDDGDNTINGTTGDDTLDGKGGDDTLNGGAGDDTLIGGTGDDTLFGGAGSDTASYASSISGVVITLVIGTNSAGHFVGVAGDGLGGSDRLIAIENVIGSAHDDIIEAGGGSQNNTFDGGEGNDTFLGGNGSDTISGGAGKDILDGWADNDVLDGGAGSDQISGWAGNDTIILDLDDAGSDTVAHFGMGSNKIRVETGGSETTLSALGLARATRSGNTYIYEDDNGTSGFQEGSDTLHMTLEGFTGWSDSTHLEVV